MRPASPLSLLLQIDGMALQKVRPALQLVSETMATVIERHLPKKTEEARVIRVMDAACDVLNAIHPNDLKVLRRGYRASPEQEAALTAAYEEASSMTVKSSRKPHPYAFQKSLKVTVRSVRGLLADIREAYGDDTYLLTRRANQDRLESFFSLVRQRGGSSLNPTPTEVKSRIRLLTLLLVMRYGVNPLRQVKDAEEDAEEDAKAGKLTQADKELLTQMESIDEETRDERPEADAEADLDEFATPDAEDDLLALLEENTSKVSRPQQATGGAKDLETGVPAAESAMAYVAGCVARSCTSAGEPSSLVASDDGPLRNLWTRLRTQHRLTMPSEEMWNLFRDMETCFNLHHAGEPGGLSRSRGVIANFRKVLKLKFPDVPDAVRVTFARVRTFIRLGRVNDARLAESLAKRSSRKRKDFTL